MKDNKSSEILKPGETIHELKQGKFKIILDEKNFRFGIDAVLLSYFANIKDKDAVIDLCTGSGIIPLLTAAKTKCSYIGGIEIQERPFDMAERAVKLNGLENRIKLFLGDIKQIHSFFPKKKADVVTVNPPYMKPSQVEENLTEEINIARHEVLCNIEDVVNAADYVLKPHGRLFMVHRPGRLSEIFASLAAHKMEPKRIRFVQPSDGKEANIVLIEARKNSQPDLRIEPVLNVYKAKGVYSDEVTDIYKSF